MRFKRMEIISRLALPGLGNQMPNRVRFKATFYWKYETRSWSQFRVAPASSSWAANA